MFENQALLVMEYDDYYWNELCQLTKVILDHVVFLMIQIREVFLYVLMIVIQFYVQDHEFFPKEIIYVLLFDLYKKVRTLSFIRRNRKKGDNTK